MESLEKMIEQGRLCRSLRTKTMFYQVEEPESKIPELHGPFWCARTQGLYGPDGKITEPEDCRPGRSCCETA
jgi:hypothetical protein